MGIGLKNRLAVGATPVPDVFIDTYMAGASGEYVKVYLYLLRHSDRFRRRQDSKFHRFPLQRNPWQALVPLRHLQKLPRGKPQPAICHA